MSNILYSLTLKYFPSIFILLPSEVLNWVGNCYYYFLNNILFCILLIQCVLLDLLYGIYVTF